jgi:CubicO group peptidase (beta-lactamase class C family)
MRICKPATSASFVLVCLLATSVFGAFSTTPPPCPWPGEPPLPAECNITSTNFGWNGAVNCLNALVRIYPTYFTGATLGLRKDNMAGPLLYANGVAGTGYADGNPSRIASVASVTKPIVYAAGLKLIQDHLSSPECAVLPDGTRGPDCVFPNGVESRVATVLARLDQRNGTNLLSFLNNHHLDVSAADRAVYDSWKFKSLKVKHLFLMTSGTPTLQYAAEYFCRDAQCTGAKPGDTLCPIGSWNHGGPHTSECGYSYLYNSYLERRGGIGALPDTCRPRPAAGPRDFEFDTYYGGNVYDPVRMQKKFERRYIGAPFVYNDCIFAANAVTGARAWTDGRKATAREIAIFSLGVPLQYEPGTGTTYSQYNLAMIALFIEEMERVSFNAYIKRKFFVPLDMLESFFVPERNRPSFAPGGANHYLSHGSTNSWDHSLDEGGTDTQFARLLDVKRIPTTPQRVIPDVAPGLWPNVAKGPDLNWDEARYGWETLSPEGGLYSTSADLLKFLRFLRNGRADSGTVILQPFWLGLLTNYIDPISGRTYGFYASGDQVGHGGFFGSLIARNKVKGLNTAITSSTLMPTPHGAAHRVPYCDLQYADRQRFLGALEALLQSEP